MQDDAKGYEDLVETMKAGDVKEMQGACQRAMRGWKDAPVERLLELKERFRRLDLEDRESRLDEALISIAEKRPGPFTGIATEPGHPLWRPSVEVLSMVCGPGYRELFVSLLPLCARKDLPYLIRALGACDGPDVLDTLAPYLASDSDDVFFEALRVVKRIGGPEALKCLRKGLEAKRREGSEMVSVIEEAVRDMEAGG